MTDIKQISAIAPAKTEWKDRLSRVERLALTRLREIEHEMKDQYGLKLVCGIELEFHAKTKKGNLTNSSAKKFTESAVQTKLPERRSLDNMISKNDFKNSPTIHKIYKETPRGQYEIVLGPHSDEDLSDDKSGASFNHYKPSVIAHSASIAKNLVTERSTELTGYKSEFSAFESSLMNNHTAGLQISLSLWNGNTNLVNHSEKNLLNKKLINSQLETQNDFLPFIINSPNSLARFQKGKFSPIDISSHDDSSATEASLLLKTKVTNIEKTDPVTKKSNFAVSTYYEGRLADAESSPAVQTLIAVIGIYKGLKESLSQQSGPSHKTCFSNEKGTFTIKRSRETENAYPIPRHMPEYEKRLNDLSKNESAKKYLGAELFDALIEKQKQIFQRL